MDLVTGLMSLALAVVFGIVIYFILVSSMKEKTYDEVKAEQKKKAEEYLAQGRTAKEKAKDKKLKKAGKKVKEKTASEQVEVSSDEVDSKGHVAFVEPPIVLDEEPAALREIDLEKPSEIQPSVQKQLSNKQSKGHTNPTKEPKTEKPQPQKVVQQTQKLVQQVKKPMTDKPDPATKPAAKQQEKQLLQPQQKLVEEVVAKVPAKPVHSALPVTTVDHPSPSISSKSSRKKRSEFATLQQMSGEKDAVNVSAIMPLVHKAELSRTEIQVLIDLLLNKQQESSVDSTEWIEGRQDPMVKLRKQLAEKEKALGEEQEAAMALQNKLRELRSELNSERHNTRQLEESLAMARQELTGLGGRVQHSVEEKQTLVQQIQQLQAKLSEEHMLLCKMKEEQGQTQGVMQQEILAQRQQLELHIARLTEQHQETIAAMEAQMGQMAAQIQEQESVNGSLNNELALLRERGAHLQDSAAQTQDLARQIKDLHAEIERVRSKSQYDTSRLQSEVSSLTEQLTLKRSEVEKLSSLTKSLQTENNRLTHQVSNANVEAQQLRDENETLAAQVTASMERPATEGRENGDLAYPIDETKHLENSSVKQEKDHIVEKLKDEITSKEKDINHLKTELAQKETLVTSFKSDLDKSQVNTEKILKELSYYKCQVQELEGSIKLLREDKESANKMAASVREDKTEIARLSKDCASRESTIEKLTSELNTHKTKMADQAATIQILQKEIERYKVSLEAQGGTKDEKDRLIEELNKSKTELSEKTTLATSLTHQCEAHLATISELRKELETSCQKINKVSQEVTDLSNKHLSLSEELLAQKRKNDELRSRNWTAMEALSNTEKILETKMKESQKLVCEAERTSKREEQERTKQLLQRILPHVTVDSKHDYEEWLEQFAAGVAQTRSTDKREESNGTMLAELERQNCQLQAMVTHYKAIIADTEGMLNRLQSHVEQEEGRWGQQIRALETQLEAITRERDRLQSGVRNGPNMVDAVSQTDSLRKRKSFTGWIRHKLRSRSRSRRSHRSQSKNGHESA